MLVLTRKNSEEVMLGNNIRLRVLSIRGNTVRIGIDAPISVSIKRGELVNSQHILPISGNSDWVCGDDVPLPAEG